MKLVSTVKLKKWKAKMLATKDYALRIDEIAKMVFSSVEESNNPYFTLNLKANKNLYIVLSSSLGLCGAYNNNIFRLADSHIQENDEAIILYPYRKQRIQRKRQALFFQPENENREIDDNEENR